MCVYVENSTWACCGFIQVMKVVSTFYLVNVPNTRKCLEEYQNYHTKSQDTASPLLPSQMAQILNSLLIQEISCKPGNVCLCPSSQNCWSEHWHLPLALLHQNLLQKYKCPLSFSFPLGKGQHETDPEMVNYGKDCSVASYVGSLCSVTIEQHTSRSFLYFYK